jgi:hypothetical protein
MAHGIPPAHERWRITMQHKLTRRLAIAIAALAAAIAAAAPIVSSAAHHHPAPTANGYDTSPGARYGGAEQ